MYDLFQLAYCTKCQMVSMAHLDYLTKQSFHMAKCYEDAHQKSTTMVLELLSTVLQLRNLLLRIRLFECCLYNERHMDIWDLQSWCLRRALFRLLCLRITRGQTTVPLFGHANSYITKAVLRWFAFYNIEQQFAKN